MAAADGRARGPADALSGINLDSQTSSARSYDFAQFQQWTLKRFSPSSHARPQIADISDPLPHVPQRKGSRAHISALQLFPRAGCGYWGTGLRANSVGCGVSCTPAVTAGIHKDSMPSIDLVKFLCEVFRILPDKQRPNRMGKSGDLFHVCLPVEWDHNVESLRARGLHSTRKSEFVEQLTDPDRCSDQHALVVDGWIQIEHTDVRVVHFRRS